MVTGATSTSSNNTNNVSSIKSEMNNDSNSSGWMDSSSNISSTSPGLNCSNQMPSSNTMVVDSVNISSNTKKSISDNRRSNKPIMEKRRRARINNCLNELKNLLLDAMKKDPARHSKLEKADILEMTVKYLANIQKKQQQQPQSPNAMANTEYGLNKYKAGFNQCFSEVTRFPGLEPEIKTRLLHHLSACINKLIIQQPTQSQTQQIQSSPIQLQNQAKKDDMRSVQVHILPNELQVSSRQYDIPQVVQNGIFVSNGVQLVPTRLPNGDIALILPNNYQNTPHVVKSSFIPVATVPPSNTGHVSIENSNQNLISFGGTNLKTKSGTICSEIVTINNNYVDIQEKAISPLPLIVPKKTDSIQPNNQTTAQHAYQYKQLQEQSDQPQQDMSPWRPW